MKIGDLVRIRPVTEWCEGGSTPAFVDLNDQHETGVIVDFKLGEPIVYWNERFPEEIEYKHQLHVVGSIQN